jgi:hypothetical protein
MTKTLALAIVVSGAVLAQTRVAGQHAPDPVNDTILLPGGTFCAFDVEATVLGKAKRIELPNGGYIATSPGLDITLTNLSDTSRQLTLNITGAIHAYTEPGGITTGVTTGRSVLFNPSGPLKGIVVRVSRFRFLATGDPTQPVEVLEGQGQLIDACALMS